MLTKEAAELAQAVLRLRTENKELRRAKIPSRTSSDLRNKHLEFSSVPRRQKSQQQDELTAAKDQIARLEAELEQEKLNYVKSEKARKQAVNAQALLTRTDPSSFDDEHFREQVENLQFKVGHWVRNQDWKVFDPRENIPEDIQKRCRVFEPTCPQYHHYLYSKRGIELLMEAHVWQFLGLEIFGQDLWALTEEAEKLLSPDKYGNPFADWKKYLGTKNPKMCARLLLNRLPERSIGEDQKEMLQAWRVASARLLAARKSPAVYTAIMNATQDLVLDFTEDEVGLLARGSLDIVKLELLCREAVQLDSVIQQQRPNYHFYPIFRSRNWKWGFLPTCMEIFGDDGKYPAHRESQEVKLVLRPGFRKFGNSAGKNYNQEISILNMVVELKGK